MIYFVFPVIAASKVLCTEYQFSVFISISIFQSDMFTKACIPEDYNDFLFEKSFCWFAKA